MRVYRGRADSIEADRAVTDRLVERVATGDGSDARDREPAVRVWRPHRLVAFGRRDAHSDGYERAREAARLRGFPPVERDVGGRAVVYTGSTVAFVRATPVDDPRGGLTGRYDAALADLQSALADLGVDASEGEPPDSFCPGSHSLQADCPPCDATEAAGAEHRPRKLAGLAQRVRSRVAVVAGVLVVADHDGIAEVTAAVYEALDTPFDPESLGSVALAGGDADPERVVRAVEGSLVGDRDATVEHVDGATGGTRDDAPSTDESADGRGI